MTTSPSGSPLIGTRSTRPTDRADRSRLDHEHRAGLVAIAREAGGEERIVGHLCLAAVIHCGCGAAVAA